MASSPDKLGLGLTIAAALLVAVQVLVAGVIGIKPPVIKSGYYQPSAGGRLIVQQVGLSETRKHELERLLAPPPVLAWVDEFPSGELQTDLLDSAVLLSFVDEASDSSPPPPPTEFKVEPVYLAQLPDLQNLSADLRKKRFIATVLPLILRANLELKERRRLIKQAVAEGDLQRLQQWAELYRLPATSEHIDDLEADLLVRVDAVPVSIALAQAAIESGWGTSRFATQGNALYGQWAWSLEEGLRPEKARFENAVVRSFANLFDSVRAYMHNLNTHQSYEGFRTTRAARSSEVADLVETLILYSEERGLYVEKVLAMIEKNNFTVYDEVALTEE
jgi:Bax protein